MAPLKLILCVLLVSLSLSFGAMTGSDYYGKSSSTGTANGLSSEVLATKLENMIKQREQELSKLQQQRGKIVERLRADIAAQKSSALSSNKNAGLPKTKVSLGKNGLEYQEFGGKGVGDSSMYSKTSSSKLKLNANGLYGPSEGFEGAPSSAFTSGSYGQSAPYPSTSSSSKDYSYGRSASSAGTYKSGGSASTNSLFDSTSSDSFYKGEHSATPLRTTIKDSSIDTSISKSSKSSIKDNGKAGQGKEVRFDIGLDKPELTPEKADARASSLRGLNKGGEKDSGKSVLNKKTVKSSDGKEPFDASKLTEDILKHVNLDELLDLPDYDTAIEEILVRYEDPDD